MSRTRIKYGNFAPEAKENFSVNANDTAFDNLSQLNEYNLFVPNYANPCEQYQTVLDGSRKGLPSETENTGFWSESISGEDGAFDNPIIIALTSEKYFTSQSISIVFDKDNGIFCNHISVSWFKDDSLLGSEEYFPDSAEFSCVKTVENYNAVTILFYSINMPYNRMKIRSIDHGEWRWLEGNDLRNVKILQEIDPISTEISINTADIELDIDSDSEVIFQPNQPVEIYFNDVLHSVTLTKDWSRPSKTKWKIETEDYIGKMDTIDFHGGFYDDVLAANILEDIFSTARVPFAIDESVSSEKVSGYISYTSCREALKQVCFAINAVADTSYSDSVRIKRIDKITSQEIPLERIMQGQRFDYDDGATSVEITVHSFSKSNERVTAYSGDSGNNVFVKFKDPLHSLEIENGKILYSHENYAIIDAFENCSLIGKKYIDEQTIRSKRSDVKYSNVKEKTISIQNRTLITSKNVDKILDLCYNFYSNNDSVDLNIVEGKRKRATFGSVYGSGLYGSFLYGNVSGTIGYIYNSDKSVKVGEFIRCQTEYLGTMSGIVLRQRYNLNGGIIIKNTEIKRS